MWKIGVSIGIVFCMGSWSISCYSMDHTPVQNSSINTRNDDCQWVAHNTSLLPAVVRYAVLGGFDRYQVALYVGRLNLDSETNVVKVNSLSKFARYSHNGIERSTTSYELLTGTYFAWIPAFERIPNNAIIAGKTKDSNDDVYIGRAYHRETLTVGKVHSGDKKLSIPYNGREYIYDNFEILIGPHPICK